MSVRQVSKWLTTVHVVVLFHLSEMHNYVFEKRRSFSRCRVVQATGWSWSLFTDVMIGPQVSKKLPVRVTLCCGVVVVWLPPTYRFTKCSPLQKHNIHKIPFSIQEISLWLNTIVLWCSIKVRFIDSLQ